MLGMLEPLEIPGTDVELALPRHTALEHRDQSLRNIAQLAATAFFIQQETDDDSLDLGTEGKRLLGTLSRLDTAYEYRHDGRRSRSGTLIGRLSCDTYISHPYLRGLDVQWVRLNTDVITAKSFAFDHRGTHKELAIATSLLANADLPRRQRRVPRPIFRSHVLDVVGEPTRRFLPRYSYNTPSILGQLREHVRDMLLGSQPPRLKLRVKATVQRAGVISNPLPIDIHDNRFFNLLDEEGQSLTGDTLLALKMRRFRTLLETGMEQKTAAYAAHAQLALPKGQS